MISVQATLKNIDDVLIEVDTKEKGSMTEDEYYDLELDRNYEYKDESLLHNFNNFGWLDPF